MLYQDLINNNLKLDKHLLSKLDKHLLSNIDNNNNNLKLDKLDKNLL